MIYEKQMLLGKTTQTGADFHLYYMNNLPSALTIVKNIFLFVNFFNYLISVLN